MSTSFGPVALLGRVLLCVIFFVSAVAFKIPKFNDVVGIMANEGIPQPKFMLIGAIAFLIAGSLMVVLGWQARLGAALLLVFLILATYYFHDFWNMAADAQKQQEEMGNFMKNLALMGAMLVLIANGPGAWSLGRRSAAPAPAESK
jgi:putative oxidoreductase